MERTRDGVDFEEDVSIDESALDIEWLRQPSLVLKYVRISVEARSSLDMAKEALDVHKAELDLTIRSHPEKYGLVKITEASITAVILLDGKTETLMGNCLQKKFDFEIAKGVVVALEHKKAALENLVKLHGQSYFAGPLEPRDLTKEKSRREMQREADSKIRINRKER